MTTVVNDIIDEIIQLAPLEWLYVDKRARGVAIHSILRHLKSPQDHQQSRCEYYKVALGVRQDALFEIINGYEQDDMFCFMNAVMDISNDQFEYTIMKNWQLLTKDALEILVESGVIETYICCKVIMEHGLDNKYVKSKVKTHIWHSLFDHDFGCYRLEEWHTEAAKCLLSYTLKRLPGFIGDYITLSVTYPVNWDPDCMDEVLKLPGVVTLVNQEALENARKSIDNSRRFGKG
jgi:hypothetical protein